MEGNNSQKVGTSSVNPKEEYGPWLLVKGMKSGQKGGAPRTLNTKKWNCA